MLSTESVSLVNWTVYEADSLCLSFVWYINITQNSDNNINVCGGRFWCPNSLRTVLRGSIPLPPLTIHTTYNCASRRALHFFFISKRNNKPMWRRSHSHKLINWKRMSFKLRLKWSEVGDHFKRNLKNISSELTRLQEPSEVPLNYVFFRKNFAPFWLVRGSEGAWE